MAGMKLNRFAKYAWAVLGYNLAVILWGAYVRASGSGAGCGSHWPLCNGVVLPRSPQLETIVELTHRATSGVALLLVVGLAVWALRAFSRGSSVRRAAALSLFFMLTEAAVGAGLVLFELVAENRSIARALFMSVHLVNTFLLVGMLTLTAWWGSGGARGRASGRAVLSGVLGLGVIGVLVLGVSGSVTALGGTLFPVASLAEGLRQDLSPTSHVLIRLRFFHPWIAVAVSGYLVFAAWVAWRRAAGWWAPRLAGWLVALLALQLAAGLLNLALHAPIWLQLAHLLLSDLIWIALVLLANVALARPAEGGERVGALAPAPSAG